MDLQRYLYRIRGQNNRHDNTLQKISVRSKFCVLAERVFPGNALLYFKILVLPKVQAFCRIRRFGIDILLLIPL
jgi:hypothetical protein